jgi:hypothetical protein
MKKKKYKTVFEGLKKNKIVHDTWYGNGKVLKVTTRSAYIYLNKDQQTHRYDREHVNGFIKLGTTPRK